MVEVWVILYHGREPNELLESKYYTSKGSAEGVAEWIKKMTQCKSTAVEVRQLERCDAT